MDLAQINTDGSPSRKGPGAEILRKAGFNVREVEDADFVRGWKSNEETIELLHGASAVIASGERYTAEVINSLPDLRVIARHGVGFERVDVDAATAANVLLTITPTANHEAVAEHAMALILATSKSLVTVDKLVRSGSWGSPRTRLPLRQSTIGIVGLGRIGRSLATRAEGMGMNIIATELYPNKEFVEKHGIKLVDLDTLLAESDFVSLHCPLSKETQGLINSKKLSLMKPTAILVNTARGGLIVESDLIKALKSGTIGGAGLDVFEQEPSDSKNPLFEFDTVVLSPHIAGNDELSLDHMSGEAAQCIVDLSRGKWPDEAVINKSLKDSWKW